VIQLPLGPAIDVGGVLSFWQFFFGLLFVVVILIAPREGIWGFVQGRIDTASAAVRRRMSDD